jgi:DNA-binding NarL/FixJ family response regulator
MKTPRARKLRFLLADDHASTRVGIRQILQEAFRNAAFGEAADAAEALRQAAAARWDLMVLDISLPDRDGLDVLRELRARQAGVPVLVFSVHPEDQFAARALHGGAAGYMSKERAPEELPAAVRKILAGGTWASPALAARLAAQPEGRPPALPHERLSEREFQVFRMLAQGRPGKVIAADLGISQKTVTTHRARLLLKLGLHSTAELVRYAVRNGFAG